MKAMTCRELGGACDMKFYADTFEEIVRMSQEHGREMFLRGDRAHLEAMNRMRDLIKSRDAMAEWMESRRKEFEAKPGGNDA